jgi:hypothetical protein
MIPALLQLDQDITTHLTNLLEPGTDQNYVTLDYLLLTYPVTPHHHIDQIKTRIQTYLQTHGKHTYQVILEEDCCMSCGQKYNVGYSNAYQFLKFKNANKCPYNYYCENYHCDCIM